MTVRLAVTLGDPRGIGPEVVGRAAARLREESPHVALRFLGARPAPRTSHEESPFPFDVEEVADFDGTLASAGRVTGAAVERAVELALRGEVDGIVTGPIHKPAFRAAGYAEPGHTELLQRLTGAAQVGMLMVAEETRLGGPLRVLLATTHLPLREVPERVTTELIVTQSRILDRGLREGWGIDRPRLALCGLNPHASDGGLFGSEEAEVLAPAVAILRSQAVEIQGPLPADTVFGRAVGGEFDAVVVPYHDVGMAPFKTVAFGGGVNVTLGLPFPRTSPDHGTAFDLVGTGRADPSSTLQALRLATHLASPAGGGDSL